jgi:DNA polymerase III subunit delta
MILKSFEIKKNQSIFLKHNFFLLYGENFGLKKDIKEFIKSQIEKNESNVEILSFYENEIINNEENFFNSILSGSLFSSKKIIIINESTDKIINYVNDIYEKSPKEVSLIFFAEVLDKKSKLRNFFETNKNTVCIPCYLDNEKDLAVIAKSELKKIDISFSRELVNLLIEKSNQDRNNLRNELEKIKSYALNKKNLDIEEIKSLINFTGDYKSDLLINQCLCGEISEYKKILSELYINASNYVLFLRILNNKVQRLLKIQEQNNKLNSIDKIISALKPPIFWKEKPTVKKQLSIWNKENLNILINETNSIELLCKKNPNISNVIFFNFFSKICVKANNFS